MVKVYEEVISSKNGKFCINTRGILKENTLKFSENNTLVTIKFNSSDVNIIKSDSDKEIILNFSKNKSNGYYFLKTVKFKSELTVITNSILVNENLIKLDYDLFIANEDMGNFKIIINISNK